MSMDEGTRQWLLGTALNHPDRDQRRAALLLMLNGEVSNADLPYIAPWAVLPLLSALDNVRRRFGHVNVADALDAIPDDAETPRWAGNGAAMVAMFTLLIAALRHHTRDDDVKTLVASVGWYADIAPTYTAEETLDAVEWAERYACCGEYVSPATLVGLFGVDTLCAARMVDGRDAELELLDRTNDRRLDYSARYRAEQALTWATVLRDNGIPCDGTKRWTRTLDWLCAENPTVDDMVDEIPDEDGMAFIEQFTVDGEPVTELILAGVDVPDWMLPWVGA
ncbi:MULTISPECIES: hypothetical protein [Mycobacteroides]|uniref:hypothetical protein n=1 Tax=Mycobacteroides TaxID=670516 RepID=UPI000993679B|nr:MULTISPECIES: hypothetical protein [Mycobacteroides]